MTKLEEKLKELGYEKEPEYKSNQYLLVYTKRCIGLLNPIVIFYDLQCDVISPQGIRIRDGWVLKQEQIYVLQQAFNEMQSDLEELKKYEQ